MCFRVGNLDPTADTKILVWETRSQGIKSADQCQLKLRFVCSHNLVLLFMYGDTFFTGPV